MNSHKNSVSSLIRHTCSVQVLSLRAYKNILMTLLMAFYISTVLHYLQRIISDIGFCVCSIY